MKSKVVNRIPGKKAKDLILDKKPLDASGEIDEAGAGVPKPTNPEKRETLDDKNRKIEARREFEAAVRGKLKNSRKR